MSSCRVNLRPGSALVTVAVVLTLRAPRSLALIGRATRVPHQADKPRRQREAQGVGCGTGEVRGQQRDPHLATVRYSGAPPPPPQPGPAAPGLRAFRHRWGLRWGRARPSTPTGRARPSVPHRAGTPVNPLRHADGGALAQRIYIHQLPQTAPRLAELIQGVFGPAARDSRAVSAARLGGNPDPQGAPNWAAQRRGRCVTELKQWPDGYRL
jgi:hypothetical protein